MECSGEGTYSFFCSESFLEIIFYCESNYNEYSDECGVNVFGKSVCKISQKDLYLTEEEAKQKAL